VTTDTTSDTAPKPKRSRAKKSDPATTVTIDRDALLDALNHLVPLVPRQPVAPYEAGVRIAQVGRDPRVSISTADAFELHASIDVEVESLQGDDIAGPEVWDARRLRDMVKGVRGAFVTLAFADRTRATVSGSTSGLYSMPLYRSPEEFPVIDWDPSDTALVDRAELLDALARVAYAVGDASAGPVYRNAQVSANGVVCGFNGGAMQAASVSSWPSGLTLLVPDIVLGRLGILDSDAAGIGADLLIGSGTIADRQNFVGLTVGRATIAYAKPNVEPHDLTRAWDVVDEVQADSGTLRLPVAELVDALDSAKVQADPRMPVVELDLDAPVMLRSGLDDTNRFEYRFDAVVYQGRSGHRIRLGLTELRDMVYGSPDEFVDLLIEEAATGNSREPYVQYIDSTNARAVLQQVRV